MQTFYVYIITNKNNTVLYTGFTDDVFRRSLEHKEKLYKGFTAKWNCNKIVYYETYYDADEAIRRERQLKRYLRKWKEELIDKKNPDWKDLFEEMLT
ncbi:GIY-YIG nuclease family protein [Roseivirga sp. BDSF3-8]|uniref:GIY-YIG nuclease family protein n=1 Tax=Roseivirga sp. BDSF3-8 TaxID=3241598 RepID=UPI003531EAE3